MIYFKDYQKEYQKIFDFLLTNFDPGKVAMVSLGTLTFIKPVIKTLRKRNFKSKILQMPLIPTAGKLSYPKNIKTKMFKFAYNSLKKWHNKVYFYLCMEPHELWMDVFGKEYVTNESFEMDMKYHYFDKLLKV